MLLAKRVAVVDDDFNMALLVKDILATEGLETEAFSSAAEALERFKTWEPNVLITDLRMKDVDGMGLLKQTNAQFPSIVTVLMTAFGSIETAVEAMKSGAYHYLVKPFKNDELVLIVQRALEKSALKQENFFLRQELKREFSLDAMVGKSPLMLELFDLIKRVSAAAANVLISGESGTGKELVALAMHGCSPRREASFVPVICSSIPETVLEKELFGTDSEKGKFDEARGGTLFLDDVDCLSPNMQSKLLRVLQDKVIRPLGSEQFHPIDVRLIVSTTKDLATLVAEEKFRNDLYYRLNVIPIKVPALRDRQKDIPLLAQHFLKKYAVANHSPAKSISNEAMSTLLSHPWPGNVGELQNIIERSVVLAKNQELQREDVLGIAIDNAKKDFENLYSDRPSLEKLEERYITMVLGEMNGQKEKAAKALGISRRTLYRKERNYGLVDADAAEPSDLAD